MPSGLEKLIAATTVEGAAIQDWGVSIELGPLALVILVLAGAAYLIYHLCLGKRRSEWSVVEAEIPFGGGRIKIKPNHDDIQVAHKAWVQLASRKAGLPFDEEHDVIIEVYDSWYDLFKEMRLLASQIPAERMRESQSTRDIVDLILSALNSGLRPHLTVWQAQFRTWYEAELEKNPGVAPQVIQKKYELYGDLVQDLKAVNGKLMTYMTLLKNIARGV